jgi:signal transduction histidine kinase
MTSVLYSAGLNYQGGNPLRTEIRGLRASITALEGLAQEQAKEIAALKALTAALEKSVRAASAASASATTASAAPASAAATVATTPPS